MSKEAANSTEMKKVHAHLHGVKQFVTLQYIVSLDRRLRSVHSWQVSVIVLLFTIEKILQLNVLLHLRLTLC